jgi:hypothetical protein
MRILVGILLFSMMAFGQGVALPPISDPFWQTKDGHMFIKRYQDLEQCDAMMIKSLQSTWPDIHCVKNSVGKGNHAEFKGQLYDPDWISKWGNGRAEPERTLEVLAGPEKTTRLRTQRRRTQPEPFLPSQRLLRK